MLIIGITGGSGSGKTTVVRKISESLPENSTTIISLDSYYVDSPPLTPEERAKINFDHPDSFDYDLLIRHIRDLKNGKPIEKPIYSYVTCTRAKEAIPVYPGKILIVEGILVFAHPELLQELDIKIFVDAEPDDRLMRIIRRDTIERGRNYEESLRHYEEYVKLMHQQFIEPSKRFADVIIPQGGENNVAIEILTARILEQLRK